MSSKVKDREVRQKVEEVNAPELTGQSLQSSELEAANQSRSARSSELEVADQSQSAQSNELKMSAQDETAREKAVEVSEMLQPTDSDIGQTYWEQEGKWKQKPRTALLNMVFSRRMFVVLTLLLQLGVVFAAIKWLDDYQFLAFGGFSVLGAVVTVNIINSTMNPSQKLSWIVLVLAAPVFGGLMYLYVRADILTRGFALGLEVRHKESMPYRIDDSEAMERLRADDEQATNLAGYLHRQGDFPVYENTEATYFPLGEDKWVSVLEELKKAEHFIFMEYFIVDEGLMWNSVLAILKEKAAQGVEVRVMYDGTCAMSTLPFAYPKKLQEMGIQCKMFSPMSPVLSTVQNNRDHRKILVIDGRVGYTGGINMADEYINRRERFGHWKDTAVMLKGDAVQSLTLMFLEMWNMTVRGEENWGKYCVTAEALAEQRKNGEKTPEAIARREELGYVIPYCDSPLDKELVGEYVYLDILNTAKHYVHIITPYLILDNETITALKYAAKRGIETIIIMPHVPDKWYAYYLGRTHYEELIQAGVQIYEYTPGFVHAKVFASDDVKAVVGTINLDFRSLYLHFECAAYFYRNPVVADVEADFQATLAKCQKITMEDCKKLSPKIRLVGRVLKFIAPLM